MDINTAITLLLAIIDNLQRVSAVIAAARAAGRETLTPQEWAGILAVADAARAAAMGEPPAASAAPQPPVPTLGPPLTGDPVGSGG